MKFPMNFYKYQKYPTKQVSMKKKTKGGGGLINKFIDKLPFELHLPGGYQYCGPGTKLKERIAQGQRGINKLDAACREHDIAYSTSGGDTEKRRLADLRLAEEAWKRVKASDSDWKEKTAAWTVTTAMKAKTKLGGGHRKKGRPAGLRKGISLAKRALRDAKPTSSLYKKTLVALKAAKSGIHRTKKPYSRVIPVPKKKGGILPFLMAAIPALAALGSVAGGAASLVKTINDGKRATQELEEKVRHNKKMEEIAIGKGLYLKPWKGGLGLYVKSKN